MNDEAIIAMDPIATIVDILVEALDEESVEVIRSDHAVSPRLRVKIRDVHVLIDIYPPKPEIAPDFANVASLEHHRDARHPSRP